MTILKYIFTIFSDGFHQNSFFDIFLLSPASFLIASQSSKSMNHWPFLSIEGEFFLTFLLYEYYFKVTRKMVSVNM